LDRGVAFDEIRIKALLSQDDADLEKAAIEIQTDKDDDNGDEEDDDASFE
jgi:hypothetical protein